MAKNAKNAERLSGVSTQNRSVPQSVSTPSAVNGGFNWTPPASPARRSDGHEGVLFGGVSAMPIGDTCVRGPQRGGFGDRSGR